ncbi:hypothetical protein ACVWXM_009992 [Bradyrhizobium sp. GM7.3]
MRLLDKIEEAAVPVVHLECAKKRVQQHRPQQLLGRGRRPSNRQIERGKLRFNAASSSFTIVWRSGDHVAPAPLGQRS